MSVYRINTDGELQSLLTQFNCSSVDDLADYLFHLDYSTLYDNRPNSEFTGANAQSSEEFFFEELSIEEYKELQQKRNLYV